MKFDDTPSREEREDFWLDLGPASAYEGLDCCETARRDGDASPDGLAHGFEGAESPKDLVAPPDDDPDSEPVPHLPPQLKALEWLDTMMCRPSTDKGRKKSYHNKIHLLV